jgi:hypothetical protein
MKISSQLANNFDYCSAEIREFVNQKLFTPRPLRLRGAISESCFKGSLKTHFHFSSHKPVVSLNLL